MLSENKKRSNSKLERHDNANKYIEYRCEYFMHKQWSILARENVHTTIVGKKIGYF